MSGRLRVFLIQKNIQKEKHDHFILSTNKEQFFSFLMIQEDLDL